MQPLHGRYPFLAASRDAVEAADVDLAAVVHEGGAPVERGVERVRRALVDGTVTSDGRPGTRAELLSYPVARVLVSLVDVPGAVEKYARAEAALAYERFTADFNADTNLKSSDRERLSLDRLLADFDLADVVTPTGDGRFEVGVGAYLRLSADLEADEWRLASRILTDGRVAISRAALYILLREAVRRRVADDLPLSVPDPVADALSAEVDALHDALAAVDRPQVRGLHPEAFPPCIEALVWAARDGELNATGRFALTSFFAAADVSYPEVAALTRTDPDVDTSLSRTFERVNGEEAAAFPPPSCTTMQATGDCSDPDELCNEIEHPLGYYATRLAEQNGGDATDANAD